MIVHSVLFVKFKMKLHYMCSILALAELFFESNLKLPDMLPQVAIFDFSEERSCQSFVLFNHC